MRRRMLGILSIVLLGFGLAGVFVLEAEGSWAFLHASAIRIGFVLGAVWLAYEQVQLIKKFIDGLPGWLFWTGLLALAVAARHPMTLLFIIPVLLVLWLLRPPPKSERRRKAVAAGEKSPD